MKKHIREKDNSISKKATAFIVKKSTIKSKIPYIVTGTIVSIITISITGVVMFLETLPGLTVDKIDKLGKSMARSLSRWFNGDYSNQVEDDLIYKTVDYIDTMGYDLKNYGFLTDYKTEMDVGKNQYLDEKNGVIRDANTDAIVKAESDFMMSYLISDNYIYTFSNESSNVSFGEEIIEWITEKGSAVGSHFADFFLRLLWLTLDKWCFNDME